jgi:hypothetical protein
LIVAENCGKALSEAWWLKGADHPLHANFRDAPVIGPCPIPCTAKIGINGHFDSHRATTVSRCYSNPLLTQGAGTVRSIDNDRISGFQPCTRNGIFSSRINGTTNGLKARGSDRVDQVIL